MTMKFSNDKKIDAIVKKLIAEGCRFDKGKKHGKLRHPCGKTILIVSGSPSCSRAWKNFQHDARRILATVNHPPITQTNVLSNPEDTTSPPKRCSGWKQNVP
jgi:hypothetical protein